MTQNLDFAPPEGGARVSVYPSSERPRSTTLYSPAPSCAAQAENLKAENRELRLKAGAALTKDDDELIFEQYLEHLAKVLELRSQAFTYLWR